MRWCLCLVQHYPQTHLGWSFSVLPALHSWTTQINFMEDYPEYQFVASQAQQYEWLKQVRPEVESVQ